MPERLGPSINISYRDDSTTPTQTSDMHGVLMLALIPPCYRPAFIPDALTEYGLSTKTLEPAVVVYAANYVNQIQPSRQPFWANVPASPSTAEQPTQPSQSSPQGMLTFPSATASANSEFSGLYGTGSSDILTPDSFQQAPLPQGEELQLQKSVAASASRQGYPLQGEELQPDKSVVAQDADLKCTQAGCDRTFLRDSDLTKHQEQHAKPYQCLICQERFASEKGGKIHIHKHKHKLQNSIWWSSALAANSNQPLELCDKLRSDSFRRHLIEQHKLDKLRIGETLKSCLTMVRKSDRKAMDSPMGNPPPAQSYPQTQRPLRTIYPRHSSGLAPSVSHGPTSSQNLTTRERRKLRTNGQYRCDKSCGTDCENRCSAVDCNDTNCGNSDNCGNRASQARARPDIRTALWPDDNTTYYVLVIPLAWIPEALSSSPGSQTQLPIIWCDGQNSGTTYVDWWDVSPNAVSSGPESLDSKISKGFTSFNEMAELAQDPNWILRTRFTPLGNTAGDKNKTAVGGPLPLTP